MNLTWHLIGTSQLQYLSDQHSLIFLSSFWDRIQFPCLTELCYSKIKIPLTFTRLELAVDLHYTVLTTLWTADMPSEWSLWTSFCMELLKHPWKLQFHGQPYPHGDRKKVFFTPLNRHSSAMLLQSNTLNLQTRNSMHFSHKMATSLERAFVDNINMFFLWEPGPSNTLPAAVLEWMIASNLS